MAYADGRGTPECGEPAVATIDGGCEHEHVHSLPVCLVHLDDFKAKATAGLRIVCNSCHGHVCKVFTEIKELVDG